MQQIYVCNVQPDTQLPLVMPTMNFDPKPSDNANMLDDKQRGLANNTVIPAQQPLPAPDWNFAKERE